MITTVNDKQIVSSYPYGRLRTQATFSLEFRHGKGFRSVFQTVNPKTGRINNPKKGTYHDIMYMTNEDGFVRFKYRSFYDIAKFNDVTEFLNNHFHLYTPEQMKYLYIRTAEFLKVELYALRVYANVPLEKSMPYIKGAMEQAIDGAKHPEKNLFGTIKVDHETLNGLKDPDFKPFRVVERLYNGR